MKYDVLLSLNAERLTVNGKWPFSVLRLPLTALRHATSLHAALLLLLLLPTGLWAQDLQVCAGRGFTLASGVDAVGTSPVTYTWYENGVEVGSSNTASLGVPAGRAAGTYAYVRMASNDDCVLPSNTYTVEVLDAPAAPTGASSNARCGAGTVTFSATVPAGVTIDWYTADTGGALVSGGGSVTSFSPSINASATYYAEARHTTAGCVSATRLAVGAYIGSAGATSGQPVDPACGCASGLNNCSGICRTCCTDFTLCKGFTEVNCASSYGTANWADAKTACASIGSGWHLTPLSEMICMCKKKATLPNSLAAGNYWTDQNAFNNNAYAVDPTTCTEIVVTTSSILNYRCIK